MRRRDIKKWIEERKGDKHEVADLLHNMQQFHEDADLIEAIPLRMNEITSLIAVIQAALGNRDYDESFFNDHVADVSCLLQARVEDLNAMTEALIERASKKQPIK